MSTITTITTSIGTSRHIQLITGLLCLLIFIGCGSDSPQKDAPTMNDEATSKVSTSTTNSQKTQRIVCFGNSLTAAYQLDPAQGWPALIQARIDSLGWPYEVINAGVSGETTADGLRRIEWILKQDIDVFILELGANDMLRGLTTTETQKNLLSIIDLVRSKHPECPVLLAGMRAAPNLGQDYVQAFESIFEEIPRTRDKVYLIPFFLDGVVPDPQLTLPDRMHPNAAGYKIVSNHVWDRLEGVLKGQMEG